MSENKPKRLVAVAKELGVGTATIVDHLVDKGYDIDNKPTSKVTPEMFSLLLRDFQKDKNLKERAEQISLGKGRRENVEIEDKPSIGPRKKEEGQQDEVMVKNLERQEERPEEEAPAAKETPEAPVEEKAPEKETEKESPAETTETEDKEAAPEEPAEKGKVTGPKIVGKISVGEEKQEAAEEKEAAEEAEAQKEAEPTTGEESEKAAEETKPEEAPEKEERAETPTAKEAADEAIKEDESGHLQKTKYESLEGPKVIGKIDLPDKDKKKKPVASSSENTPTERKKKKRRRKRIRTDKPDERRERKVKRTATKGKDEKEEISEKEIQEKIKATMAKLSGGKTKSSKSKIRKARRDETREAEELAEEGKQTIQVTEFISVSELASIMDVSATEVISTCMGLGIIVSINQRLDAEVIELVADEFDYEVEFINISDQAEDEVEEEEEAPEDLVHRAPIVTIMGHVDHGKTSLLDYIRSANVIAGEVGGITQHIGAYEVEMEDGKKITFLDTPGHEAFTAMRARGAKITDIAVIVVAADDAVMPQTKEAISHAQAAAVPIVFAINKIDKENANPEKIKEQLGNMNFLVEDWGGKYQSQDISAKEGLHVDDLLEKISLEAEILELKANPDKPARGTVVEAELDKGRGYVATILVQEGTLRVGDAMVAGSHFGRIKAMQNERGQKVTEAGPSTPVVILGLYGAPQAGEKFKVYKNEQEAKQLATKRSQIEREQGLRAQKHITLDEIGRRLALGSFQELNVIVKGDVDGSIEALADSLLKLSTEEIQVNIVHKAVGQITESDVLLASASDAIIVGFQVRPSMNARKVAEREAIEIRLYSIIYDAIDEIKSAMEGMLKPKIEEKILGNLEIRETFKISRVGTIAGCYVLDGKINRNSNVRVVRDGIVIYDGELASLKRHKDDVKEVKNGMECGLNIKNFNDIKVGDIIEVYEEVEVKRTLSS